MYEPSQSLVIKGLRQDGSKFRPSDWSERLATTQATFDTRKRLRYHHMVKPSIIDGIKCLIIDSGLRQQSPQSFDFLIAFAQQNQLETVPLL